MKASTLFSTILFVHNCYSQAVGIGSSIFTPTSMLEIRGIGNTAADSAFHVKSNSIRSLFFVNGAGNLGVGAIAPGTKLEVSGNETNNTVGAGAVAALKIVNTNIGAVGRLSEAQFGTSSTAKFAAISAYVSDGGSNTRGDILFSTRNSPTDANLTERMRIDGSGNVGIGTTAPTTKLHIQGTSGTTLKIVDGNQGASKILISDASGVASWQASSTVGGAFSQSILLTNTTGSTWTVPAGVSLIWITAWGGGGGGSSGDASQGGWGGGGGGEVYYRIPLKVTAGTSVVSYTVGAGGAGGAAGAGAGGGTVGSNTLISISSSPSPVSSFTVAGGGGANFGSGAGGSGGGTGGAVGAANATGTVGSYNFRVMGGTSGGGRVGNGVAGKAGGDLGPYAGGTSGAANQGGGGGAGFNGNGGAGGAVNTAGTAATANSGAGGGGGGKNNTGGGAANHTAGGAGGSGGILIEWIGP